MRSEKFIQVVVPDAVEKAQLEEILSQAGYSLPTWNGNTDKSFGAGLKVIDLCLLDYDLWEGQKTRLLEDCECSGILAMVTPENMRLALQDLYQGIDHLILKPFSGAALVERIEQVIQVKRTRRSDMQAERMAAVNRLTASIAHEINNPLQSVQNCIHMIQHGQLSNPALDRYIAMVNEEVSRLSKEVKRMLDFYRPGNIQRQRMEVNQLVTQIVATWETRFQDGHIDLQLELADGLPPVLVVSAQIQQAIANLLENAVEAMSDGGRLLVRTGWLENHVIIDVEDNGPGIPEAVGEQIFDPFMSTKDDRVGLGLTIAYGIVTAHRGSLELVRQKTTGAHLRISLPVG
jgi:signal transduction histidine kinase